MANLQFFVIAPEKGSRLGNLSPSVWLLSEEMHPMLQSLGLPITTFDQHWLKLDPAPIENDYTISDYHSRVLSILPDDRIRLSVHLPAEAKLANGKDECKEDEFKGLRDSLKAIQEKYDSEIEQVRAQAQATAEKVAREERMRHREERIRYDAFKANLMEKVVEKISKKQKITFKKGKNDSNADKTRLMDATNKILKKVTAQDFEKKTGLHKDYRTDLAKYEQLVDKRRVWAHETENEFAYLLLSDQFQGEKKAELNTEHWARLLLWVYDKANLQEMAAVVEDK